MTDELHIHSFADLKGDLAGKKLIVHSREVADWLTSHVSAMDEPMAAPEKPMTVNEMFDEWEKCLNDADYFRENYCSIKGDTMRWHLPNWLKAMELIQPIKPKPSGSMVAQRVINQVTSDLASRMTTNDPQEKYERGPMLSRAELLFFRAEDGNVIWGPPSDEAVIAFYEALISSGELIRRDELTKWLEGWIGLRLLHDGRHIDARSVAVYQKVLDHITAKKA